MANLVSKNCVNFVKKFEGFYPNFYNDMVGVKTLGYGMTGEEIKNVKTPITEAQASQMLEDLLNNKYATPIKKDLDSKKCTLKQNELDALVSMAYNVGVGGLLSSTLYKNVVKGIKDKVTITANFQAWSNAGGKWVEGLYRRRTEEAEMFLSKTTVASPTPVKETVKNSPYKMLKELEITKDTNCWTDIGYVKTFLKGQFITAIDEKIVTGRQVWITTIGWILKSDTKPKGYPYPLCIDAIIQVSSKLNIRELPNTTCKVVGSFDNSNKITIIDISSDGKWGKTTLGYISMDYVKIL